MIKRAIISARVSTDNQEKHGWGLPSQIEECKRYAATHGMKVVAIVEDNISGTILERPGLNEAWKLFERGEANVLIVYALDRLSRDIIGSALIRQRLADLDIELHSVTDGGLIEHEYGGNFNANVRALIANEERKLIVSRFKRGKRQKVESGSAIGNGIPPYGYRYEHYELHGKKHTRFAVIEEEAAIIRMVYDWYLRGSGSAYKIAQRLNDLGINTPSVRYEHTKRRATNRWGKQAIYRILQHPIYKGVFPQYRTYRTREKLPRMRDANEWVMLNAPAIVTSELWQAVQDKLAVGKALAARNAKREYLIGRRFVCGQCGYKVHGTSHITRTGYEERYYVCNGRNNAEAARRCTMRMYPAQKIDTLVWQWVVNDLLQPENLLQGLQALRVNEDVRRADMRERQRVLYEQRDAAQQQLDKLLDLYLRGTFDTETLDRRKRDLERQRQSADAELLELEAELLTASPTDTEIEELLTMTNSIRAELADELDFVTKRHIIELLDVRAVAQLMDGKRAVELSSVLKGELLWVESQHS